MTARKGQITCVCEVTMAPTGNSQFLLLSSLILITDIFKPVPLPSITRVTLIYKHPTNMLEM